jgi:Mg-chelatase subunit ChlD
MDRSNTRIVSLCIVLAVMWTTHGAAAQVALPPAQKPRVEVVFVLDTTGSMSGLIQAAKEKIWAIANTMAAAQPAPEIKMGLVAYRDRSDAYVTKRTPLTDDLDAVYKDLMTYRANGGGDAPESVNQALNEAVTKMAWTRDSGADRVYRVIFLVGDCPPHMDYRDDVKYPQSCKAAATAGIIINTIQCGTHGPTTPIWKDIATRAEGRYFRVEQSGGAILTDTPFDTELADLSRKLDATRVWYGDAKVQAAQEARARTADTLYAAADPKAIADRARFNAGKAGKDNFLGTQELVNDMANGKVALADLDEEHLPDNMKKMTPEQREEFIKKQAETRKQLQLNIGELSAKRRKHIDEQIRKANLAKRKGFDLAIYECVQEQGAKNGINYKQNAPE